MVGVMALVKKIGLLLAALALTGVCGWMGVREVFSICADTSLWKSGTTAQDVRVDGKVSTRKFLNTYKLKVKYRDAAGGVHEGKTEFLSFTSIDDKKSPEVHYDAQNPSTYALSWALDVPGGRWSAAVLFILAVPFFGAGIVVMLKERPAASAPRPAA